jgi:AraC family transcriptional regulator of adaptative response/methylated-DNA-[protein]-cysteine methyltransferase
MPNVAIPSDDVCWRAVEGRDRSYDGAFVYAVLSTRVYCRPSCPSRRPGRKQVVFFRLPQTAERSGFRPCGRCQPRENDGRGAGAKWVLEACRYIEGNQEEPLNLSTLAGRFRISPFRLQRTFKKVTGLSPRQYADACRMKLLKNQLRRGRSVADALYEAGYGSSSRLYERAPAQLGMTPATYGKGGAGVAIRYALAPCRLGRPGWILVGATDRGVCAVRMGDSADELERDLRAEFPRATLSGSHPQLARWLNSIVKHLQGSHPEIEIPVDVQATAFQRRVWQALAKIPYGTTQSYKEIAKGIGNPKAVRAVGHACAANPVAVIVPCHRAVRSDGKLGGYRWGLERKQALLEYERERAEGRKHKAAGGR